MPAGTVSAETTTTDTRGVTTVAAYKDRLIEAADLLGMTPDDLLSALDPPRWRPGNDGTGVRRWFLHRDAPNVADRYLLTQSGRMVRFATYEAAQQAADRLNR